MTWHLLPMPHVPTHGSLHFCLIQALFNVHSLLTIHSGLQFGGEPMKSGKHEQTAC